VKVQQASKSGAKKRGLSIDQLTEKPQQEYSMLHSRVEKHCPPEPVAPTEVLSPVKTRAVAECTNCKRMGVKLKKEIM
jgi:hypothetical protein